MAVPAVQRFHWSGLRVFLAVIQHGSIGRAASRLHLAEPVVARHLSLLDRAVGGPLLRRDARGVIATPAGARLSRHAFAVGAAVRDVLTPLRPPAPGRVALDVNAVMLGAVTARLGAHWPDTEWHGTDLPLHEAFAALVDGELDAYLGMRFPAHRELQPDGLAQLPMWREPLWVAFGPDHPMLRAPRITLADLAGETWVSSTDPAIRRHLEQVCQAAGFVPRVRYLVDQTNAIRELVAAGQAVTLSAAPVRTLGQAVVRPVEGLDPFEVVALWRPDGMAEPLVAACARVVRGLYLARAVEAPWYWSWMWEHLVEVWPALPAGADPGWLAPPGQDWDGAQAFCAVARTGGITGAAELLGWSQPTVSRRIAEFEHRCGRCLVDRSTKPVRLTPDGLEVLARLIDGCRALAGAAVQDAPCPVSRTAAMAARTPG